ncbi:MAG: hypothetical protein ACE5HB_02450 [Terriglobia bacterium]
MRRRVSWLLEMVAAILVGNAIFFLLLEPRLPPAWRHDPFRVDIGLGLDFLLCVGAYGLLRWFRRLV